MEAATSRGGKRRGRAKYKAQCQACVMKPSEITGIGPTYWGKVMEGVEEGTRR